jgi:hypothetical protein
VAAEHPVKQAGWTVLAWTLFGVYSVLAAGTIWLLVSGNGQGEGEESLGVLCLGFALVGALVATHEPRNSVGWLMLAIAISFVTALFTTFYASGQVLPGYVPLGWLGSWVWNVWLFLASTVLPLVFPDGRLLSRRWRLVVALGALGMVMSIAGVVIGPKPLELDSGVFMPNPTGIAGAASLAEALIGLGNAVGGLCFLLAGTSLVIRLRSSRGRAKQQVKWFVYVGSVVVVALLFALVELAVAARPGPEPGWSMVVGTAGWLTALMAIVIGFPVAIGNAILRHRLYDIDVVINRTLVYGLLTVLLAATYLVSVLAFRIILDPLTGKSDLAVAGSTLAVAGLFRPARARVQSVVDRRFFRSRYDATQTLEGFATQLRSELDLEALGHDLRDVVAETMQPAHVSLWLRRVP